MNLLHQTHQNICSYCSFWVTNDENEDANKAQRHALDEISLPTEVFRFLKCSIEGAIEESFRQNIRLSESRQPERHTPLCLNYGSAAGASKNVLQH